MWQFLELTLRDWKREVSPYQQALDSTHETDETYHIGKGFLELQPYYLKCLFSYVTFFVALENLYDSIYVELNQLNRKPELRVTHERKPPRDEYITKVRRIRNLSIVHPGSRKVNLLDRIAATSWQPMSIGKPLGASWDLNRMTFGSFTFRSKEPDRTEVSSDFGIGGIPELHKRCMSYVNGYDSVCADYLRAILAVLPQEVGADTWQVSDVKNTTD